MKYLEKNCGSCIFFESDDIEIFGILAVPHQRCMVTEDYYEISQWERNEIHNAMSKWLTNSGHPQFCLYYLSTEKQRNIKKKATDFIKGRYDGEE
jgi:hypothetical protein